MSLYLVVDAAGQTLDTFESWAAAARFQSAWERANLRPATIRPAASVSAGRPERRFSGLRVMMGASS